MKEIKRAIDEVADTYLELKKCSVEDFNALKNRDEKRRSNNQLIQTKLIDFLANRKEKISDLLKKESEKRGVEITKVRQFIRILPKSEQGELVKSVERLLESERDFRKQVELNLEFAITMKEAHSSKLEAIVEVAQKEGLSETGSVVFEEDY